MPAMTAPSPEPYHELTCHDCPYVAEPYVPHCETSDHHGGCLRAGVAPPQSMRSGTKNVSSIMVCIAVLNFCIMPPLRDAAKTALEATQYGCSIAP